MQMTRGRKWFETSTLDLFSVFIVAYFAVFVLAHFFAVFVLQYDSRRVSARLSTQWRTQRENHSRRRDLSN